MKMLAVALGLLCFAATANLAFAQYTFGVPTRATDTPSPSEGR
jgi:hypothetical protein